MPDQTDTAERKSVPPGHPDYPEQQAEAARRAQAEKTAQKTGKKSTASKE